MNDLPIGWAIAAIGDVCAQPKQRVPAAEENFTYIDIASIDRDLKIILQPQYLLGADAPSRARKVVEEGDVIVSMTRPNLNAVALIGEQHNDCIASTGFDVLRPIEVDPRWVFSAVKSMRFVNAMCEKVQGALYPAVKSADIREHAIALPPLAEQTRIAQKLDELLTQVDTLKARIDAIPTLLKHFRQSALAAAVSGQLTEEWRTLIVSSKGEKKPAKWLPSFLSDLGELARGKSKHRPRNDKRLFGDKYPFIQTGEVANSAGRIKTAKKFYSDFGLAQSRLFPKNTLCITIAANIADTAILDIEACFPDSVVGFVANEEKCRTQFIKYLIDVNKQNLEAFAPATAQKNINLKVLSGLVFPMPSLTEQIEIVRRVEQLFAFADQLEAKVAAAKSRIDHLTQSILAKAFRGELVAQDPNDEPASVLLERIKAQRAAAPTAKRGRKASV